MSASHHDARRSYLRRSYLQQLAFERQRYVVPPRVLAVLAGMQSVDSGPVVPTKEDVDAIINGMAL